MNQIKFKAGTCVSTATLISAMGLSALFGPHSAAQLPPPPPDNQERPRPASPQGIDDNTDDRRARARDQRIRDGERRPRVGNREVRTIDGSNNNLANPEWGSTFIALVRLGDVDYADGISSLAGPTRPGARAISNDVLDQLEGEVIPNPFGASDFVWQWGQFLDHDIGITDGASETANIPVPSGDPFFDPDGTGTQVIPFNRALFDPATGTSVSNPREQENEITAWIDGGNIYGSDVERATALRVGPDSPFMATSEGNLLPFNTDSLTNAVGFVQDPTSLFLAGDLRANEQVGLASMHTLFVREHNRLAAILKNDDPEASGEEIFQRTRRLVIAKLQKITYDEYLPVLLGEDAIPEYAGYNEGVNPGLFNEFSVAAYRYGHSLVNEFLLRVDRRGREIRDGHLGLRDAFFTAPEILTQQSDLDPIMRGLASQIHQKVDPKIITDLRNFLFGAPGSGGFDLSALNIQRGRDHGVPSYNDMREVMGLERVTEFAEISSDTELQSALEASYGDVDQIDLWVGGLAEDALVGDGAQLGELFREIHIKQFAALRDGDRFWYQNDLTSRELERIENVTLSRIIRDNTSVGSELQNNVFLVPTPRRRRN